MPRAPGLFEDAHADAAAAYKATGDYLTALGKEHTPPLAPSAASGWCWAWPEAAERFPQATTTTWSLM